MYFDFEDAHPETPTIESAISTREGVLLSLLLHVGAVLLVVFLPSLPWVQAAAARLEAERARLAELQMQERAGEAPRFVFVQPRVDAPAPAPPPRAELSDMDRRAQAPERAENPANPLPFARGNSAERVEADASSEPPREGPRAVPAEPAAGPPDAEGSRRGDATTPAPALAERGRPIPNPGRPAPGAGGSSSLASAISEVLRNIEKYVPESFNNPQGGARDFGSTIQFDTKGVEFGPWIRRFVAQVKRNWFIPYAAMSLRGHVVITFFVHRDGSISDLTVLQSSSVDAFNNAAFNALAASNPTQPLPPEYPADRAFFTVTFYYNESPPGG